MKIFVQPTENSVRLLFDISKLSEESSVGSEPWPGALWIIVWKMEDMETIRKFILESGLKIVREE